MRWRIKKKKGLLPDPEYEKIRKSLLAELDRQLKVMEQINVNQTKKKG